MTTEHLSEKEIQQYVLDSLNCKIEIIEHIQHCALCKANSEVYQLIVTGIKQQPKPAFDFDLAHSVAAQLPQTKSKFSMTMFFIYLFVFTTSMAVSISFYLFRGYLYTLFKGSFPFFTYVTLAAAITILLFQTTDMYRYYKKQMEEVEFV